MPARAPSTATRTPRRTALKVLRWTIAAMVVLVLYQAAMAGQVLSGRREALGLHEIGSHTATLLSVVIAVVAVIAWRRGQVSRSAGAGALVLPVLVYVQAQAGYAGDLDLHVPLGVSLLGLTLALLWATTRPPSPRPEA